MMETHLALQIDQRTPRIASVNRCISLNIVCVHSGQTQLSSLQKHIASSAVQVWLFAIQDWLTKLAGQGISYKADQDNFR